MVSIFCSLFCMAFYSFSAFLWASLFLPFLDFSSCSFLSYAVILEARLSMTTVLIIGSRKANLKLGAIRSLFI